MKLFREPEIEIIRFPECGSFVFTTSEPPEPTETPTMVYLGDYDDKGTYEEG